MMNNQEAAEIIRDDMKLHHDYLSGTYREALKMAISALENEKQIPKKPIRIDKNKEFDGNWKKICPLCGCVLMERITTSESSYPRYYNYTEHCLCGQAIDWTEGE